MKHALAQMEEQIKYLMLAMHQFNSIPQKYCFLAKFSSLRREYDAICGITNNIYIFHQRNPLILLYAL